MQIIFRLKNTLTLIMQSLKLICRILNMLLKLTSISFQNYSRIDWSTTLLFYSCRKGWFPIIHRFPTLNWVRVTKFLNQQLGYHSLFFQIQLRLHFSHDIQNHCQTNFVNLSLSFRLIKALIKRRTKSTLNQSFLKIILNVARKLKPASVLAGRELQHTFFRRITVTENENFPCTISLAY